MHTLCRISFAPITSDKTSGLAPKMEKLQNLDFKAVRANFNASPNPNRPSDGAAKVKLEQ